jgi:glycosyltransferase involved in cell wall biosynthesis
MTPAYSISIVISSYNRDGKVGQTLSRLYKADLSRCERVEVIVIDDGSPKPVSEVLDQIGSPPEKMDVRLIRQENSGIGATRNRGFLEANSQYVLFLDDDILVEPSVINDFVAAQNEHPGSVMFGSYPFITHETESLHQFARELYGYDRITDEPKFERVDAITSGLLCVDKSKLGGLDGFYKNDLSIPAAEEHEIIFRFHTLGIPIYNALHISATHNHHLELSWLVAQQFKYGRATAEAITKYPEIIQLDKLASMISTVDSIGKAGLKNKLKALIASQAGRRLLYLYASFLNKISPRRPRNRTVGLLASAYFWAGYREGLINFQLGREKDL